MSDIVKETYNLLNELGYTLVISELNAREFYDEFNNPEFLPKEPLLGYNSFINSDIENYRYQYQEDKIFNASKALAMLGFLYYDSTISVGIKKKNDCYLVSIYDSYSNLFFNSCLPTTFELEDVASFIAYDIQYKCSEVEKNKKILKLRTNNK